MRPFRRICVRLFFIITATFAGCQPVFAQGVFDMGALTNTLTTGAATSGTGPSSSTGSSGGFASALVARPQLVSTDTKKQFLFKPSMELRQAGYAKFVAGLRAGYPKQAQAYEKIFVQNDVIDTIGKGVGPYGLRVDNVSDAMTVWFVTMYMVANGRTDDNTHEEMSAVQKQVDTILAKVPALLNASDKEKQEIAEGMWLFVFTSTIEMEAAKTNPESMKGLQEAARKVALDQMKLNIDDLSLTSQGFVRKGKS